MEKKFPMKKWRRRKDLLLANFVGMGNTARLPVSELARLNSVDLESCKWELPAMGNSHFVPTILKQASPFSVMKIVLLRHSP